MSTMYVGGHIVRIDGSPVATLTYAGPMVTVRRLDGTTLGRLIRLTSARPHLYAVWTAAHQAVPTPSDRQLAENLTIEGAVELLLSQPGGER